MFIMQQVASLNAYLSESLLYTYLKSPTKRHLIISRKACGQIYVQQLHPYTILKEAG